MLKYSGVCIDSVGELIEFLKTHLAGTNSPAWFRGQSKATWSLVPKLLREGVERSESYLITKFKQNATLLLPHPPTCDFEWLYLMQHYSWPTRLLDWSESPLVALYFAVEENDEDDGSLWVLLPTLLNEKSNYRPDYSLEIPSFEDEHLRNYLPETVMSEHRSRLFPIAALAPRNSPRMQSQQGAFTISHRENTAIEDVGEPDALRDHVWKYAIPRGAKASIREELRILGITRFQLFPELENLTSI